MEPDFLLKIILVGDSGVGKTNLLSQFISNQFSVENKSTIGVEFATKTLNINGNVIKAQVWDTAGQERYRSITSAYYRGANGAMVVYDITSATSFDSLSKWITEIRQSADPNIILMIIGNKTDSEDSRVINKEEGINFAENQKLLFIETSAKDTTNVEAAFNQLIISILDMCIKNGITGKEARQASLRPGVSIKTNEKTGNCC
ncbi:ras-related protein RABA2a [Histomonas meleagridis]|uniref:ras-related protein RABA2a n=1 Tax=Histomonas meleagridis TaxID=135588 RepID=UPI0035598565|nr:ras-related protein RABA2a [Histomonas meleagridis]KAH0807004.1 ras-related protein RABA2a [Histomonas meleagridis]